MYKYDVEISDSARKFIKKLDGSMKKRVKKFIDSLEEKPIPKDKSHILEQNGPSMLCEGAVDKLRFYYTIEDKFVVVENIKYRGSVEVISGHSDHKSGNPQNYPNQRKYIAKLKDWFNKIFLKNKRNN